MHAAIHKRKEQQFYQFLDRFTEMERHAVLKFLRELTIRITEELAERQGSLDEER